MYKVDLSNSKGKVTLNYREIIVVIILNRPDGFRYDVWVMDANKAGRWILSMVDIFSGIP